MGWLLALLGLVWFFGAFWMCLRRAVAGLLALCVFTLFCRRVTVLVSGSFQWLRDCRLGGFGALFILFVWSGGLLLCVHFDIGSVVCG